MCLFQSGDISRVTPTKVRSCLDCGVRGLKLGWLPVSSVHGEGEHHDSDNRSGTTLVASSLLSGPTLAPFPIFSDSTPPHHSRGRSTHNTKHRPTRVEKRVRDFMHLQRHASAAEKPEPGIEIVDQREEEVFVRDDCVPYVVSRPIPEGKTLKKVVITVVSRDQGRSAYLEDYGTYRHSLTWFELSVGSPSEDSGEKWRGEVVRNLHAHNDFKEHTVEILDGKLYEKAEGGDVLTVWALANFSGLTNTVKKVTIRYVVE